MQASVCLGVGLASPSEGLGSAVGRLLPGVSVLWAMWFEGRQVAEAGTCSGGNGPGWVEFGSAVQEGTEVGPLKWGGWNSTEPPLLGGVKG